MKIEDLKKSEKHEKSGLACNCPDFEKNRWQPTFLKKRENVKKVEK